MNITNTPRDLLYAKVNGTPQLYADKEDTVKSALTNMQAALQNIISKKLQSRYDFKSHAFIASSSPIRNPKTYVHTCLNDFAIHQFFKNFGKDFSPEERTLVSNYLEAKFKLRIDAPAAPEKIIHFYDKLLHGKFISSDEKQAKQIDRKKQEIQATIDLAKKEIADLQQEMVIEPISSEQKEVFFKEIDDAPTHESAKPFKEELKEKILLGTTTALTPTVLKGFKITRAKNLCKKSSPLWKFLEKLETIMALSVNLPAKLQKLNHTLVSAEKQLLALNPSATIEVATEETEKQLSPAADAGETESTKTLPKDPSPTETKSAENPIKEPENKGLPQAVPVKDTPEISPQDAKKPENIEPPQPKPAKEAVPQAAEKSSPKSTILQKPETKEGPITPDLLLESPEIDDEEKDNEEKPVKQEQSFFSSLCSTILAIPTYFVATLVNCLAFIFGFFWRK